MISPRDRRTLAEARTFIAYPRGVAEAADLLLRVCAIVASLDKTIVSLEKQVSDKNEKIDELEDELRISGEL